MPRKDSNGNPIGGRRGLPSRQGTTADYETANGELLKKAIASASNVGGALRFGYSRDGGAYAIGIYGDGEPYTVFVRPDEDIDITLQDLIDLYEGIGDDKAHSKKGAGTQNPPPRTMK